LDRLGAIVATDCWTTAEPRQGERESFEKSAACRHESRSTAYWALVVQAAAALPVDATDLASVSASVEDLFSFFAP